MATPGRAFDSTEGIRQGVKEFCAENKKELMILLRDELRPDIAEMIAIERGKGEREC